MTFNQRSQEETLTKCIATQGKRQFRDNSLRMQRRNVLHMFAVASIHARSQAEKNNDRSEQQIYQTCSEMTSDQRSQEETLRKCIATQGRRQFRDNSLRMQCRNVLQMFDVASIRYVYTQGRATTNNVASTKSTKHAPK